MQLENHRNTIVLRNTTAHVPGKRGYFGCTMESLHI